MNFAALSKVIQVKMEEEKDREERASTNGKRTVNGKNGKKEFRCDECGRTFPAKQNLGTHMRRYHKTEILVCPVPGCNKTYKHRWDLTSHTKVAHNGEKVMCPNCGSCFSKKSNLYNHLHRGKGCPKKNDPDSPVSPVTVKKDAKPRREKINYAEVKDEYYGSDEELSDLVIDDRNTSGVIDNADTVTEDDEEIDDEEGEEQVEESYVEVQEQQPQRQNRLEFLRANRDLLQGRTRELARGNGTWHESSDQSTPSPPPVATGNGGTQQLNNLHLLADIAMAHTQYSSDTSSDHERDQDNELPSGSSSTSSSTTAPVRTIRIPNPATSPALPLNLTMTSQDKPKSSGPRTLSPGYRDIRPHVPQQSQQAVTVTPVTKAMTTAKLVTGHTNGTGAPVMMIPVPVQTSGSQPVMMIQSNGGHGVSNVIQIPTNQVLGTTSLFSANLGPIQVLPVIQSPQIITTNPILTSTPAAKVTSPTSSSIVHINSEKTTSPGGGWDDRSVSDHDDDHASDESTHSNPASTSSILRCPTCGRVCSDPAHLSNHIKLVHSNTTVSKMKREKTLKCHICEKLFGRSSHLAEHIKSVHEGNKRVYQKAVCGDCGRVFARKCSLNQHITAAHGRTDVNM